MKQPLGGCGNRFYKTPRDDDSNHDLNPIVKSVLLHRKSVIKISFVKFN